MIPSKVMAKMATLGLSEEQAIAVASMLADVEEATRADMLARWNDSHLSSRARTARYHERLGLTAREWRDLRNAVLDRDGHRCVYCGMDGNHVDHVVPLIQGGTNDIGNLVVACRECNCGKSGRTPEQWAAAQ